jgi:hypothetical protein
MNRGLVEGEGRAVLWNNFYASERTTEDEIIATFEQNANLLRERQNGNVLYHEILSFSAGHTVRGDELYRMVADVGQEYLRERAPEQLAYGVVHLDTDHIHLHLMISANDVGRSERVRLSKTEFSETQKKIERFTLEHYQELAQTRVYDRELPRERLKMDVHEQAMKSHTKEPSRKEQIKAKMHHLFERANSFSELADFAKSEGFSFYQRGQTVGVMVKDPDGQERKHRLSTLGVQDHYELTNRRLTELSQSKPITPKPRTPEEVPTPQQKQPDDVQQTVSPLEKEMNDLLMKRGADIRDPHSQENETARRERDLRETLKTAKNSDRERSSDGTGKNDRER